MPKHISNFASVVFGAIAAKAHPKPIQSFINRAYVKLLKLDMSDFDNPQNYKTLNALFTRSLVNKRAILEDKNAVISPCDSFVTELGYIEDQTLFQIKSMSYSLSSLLPHIDANLLDSFNGGKYINFYLSPRDYHRYHSPADFRFINLTHIPGKLYPVNMPFLRNKLNLFCENERVVIECVDRNGKRWFLVFVGALNVGKMHFNFMPDLRTNISIKDMRSFPLDLDIKIGDEIGFFEMGSTIVIIAEKDAIDLTIERGTKIRFGDEIAKISG
ncbi:phosphatidylserine decarboxylase proenzyme [Campylobacterota bacterium]|nr:phosphatidylserine decarboxylase proenzyme [Campylobacterota bacterium]